MFLVMKDESECSHTLRSIHSYLWRPSFNCAKTIITDFILTRTTISLWILNSRLQRKSCLQERGVVLDQLRRQLVREQICRRQFMMSMLIEIWATSVTNHPSTRSAMGVRDGAQARVWCRVVLNLRLCEYVDRELSHWPSCVSGALLIGSCALASA